MIPIKELPVGELAVWKNNRGTYIVFYTFEVAPNEKRMRLVATTGHRPFPPIGVIGDEWECVPLGEQTTEDPYQVCFRVMMEAHRDLLD